MNNFHKTPRKKSVLSYMLSALIPYSDANLRLAFKPNSFFNEIEKLSKRKKSTIKNAYYKAKKQGLIEFDQNGLPRLTEKGKSRVKVYKPKKLNKSVCLMVTFDIPESERWKRRRFRTVLREFRFTQEQKSVWISKYDYRELLLAEIKTSDLDECVNVYEVHKL